MSVKVAELTAKVVVGLESMADPVRAEGEKRYFKGTINNLGVTLPKIRALEKELCLGLERSWSVADAMELCDALLARRVFEATLLALMFLERFAGRMGEDEFARCEKWLADDLCDNWAATDHICPHIIGPILANHPELAVRVKAWSGSENRWLRRAAAVSFILLLRDGRFLDTAYEIAWALFADKNDDLVQKGNGWMLREAGAADPARLRAFLLAHGPNIPRTTLRYAIEKFHSAERAELLEATKR